MLTNQKSRVIRIDIVGVLKERKRRLDILQGRPLPPKGLDGALKPLTGILRPASIHVDVS